MPSAADYIALGGLTRRYRNINTGETISRRQYDKLFRLGPRGIASYEQLAQQRARQGFAPLARTKERVGRVVERIARGEKRSEALRTEGLSGVTLRRREDDYGAIVYDRKERRNRLVAAGRVSFYDAGGISHDDVPFGPRDLRNMSAYMNAMRHALTTGDTTALSSFVGVTVYDVFGNPYNLLTNVDAYISLAGVVEIDDFFESGQIEVAPAMIPQSSHAA